MTSLTLDRFIERYQRVSLWNQTVLRQFAFVAEAFHQVGIPFLLLKGADVISRLYGIHGSRPLADIDLLVHRQDLPAIDKLLTQLSFVQQIDGNPAYRSSSLGLALDLATSLWYLDEEESAQIWARAITRPFHQSTISCLATEDLLIYLTAYSVVHHGQLSAAFSQDLCLLIAKETPHWPTIITRAQRYGLETPIHHGLAHVQRTVPTLAIPEAVLAQLTPRLWTKRPLHWLLSTLVTTEACPGIGHLLLFVTRRRGQRVAWLQRTLWPSREFLSYRYGPASEATPQTTRLRRLYSLGMAGLALGGRISSKLAKAIMRRSL